MQLIFAYELKKGDTINLLNQDFTVTWKETHNDFICLMLTSKYIKVPREKIFYLVNRECIY